LLRESHWVHGGREPKRALLCEGWAPRSRGRRGRQLTGAAGDLAGRALTAGARLGCKAQGRRGVNMRAARVVRQHVLQV
jgi:hypothetical protein